MSSATRPFCADTSRADAEPLAATASRVETWLLLEYRGLWARDAVDGSTLSAAVKDHLRRQRTAFPQMRILFVRRTERRREDGLVAFVARTTESAHDLRCLELERYDDLLEVDLAAAGVPVEHPLFLVCTHGKHDRCCSKFGRPLYDAVREQVDEGWVWQSSHVGGDRFAGNVVSLPDGVYYGRVQPGESWQVLEAALRGEIHLPHYRGRSCHSFPAQAAERAVRERTGLVGVDDTSMLSLEPVGAGWKAVVRAAGIDYAVEVRREEGAPTHLTCSTEQLRRPKRYVAELYAGGSPPARAS
ncbi:MAG TPA: sucrase ferredoxin [Gaiellaceae bacterium]|nr:sucrase ferredoxin [Gaiellaceae bacterium]